MTDQLSATAKVILGMLASGPKSGYDIKAITDKSTRFFWAASYGQIYPELKRLAEQGLVAPSDEATDGRKRIPYEITDAGRDALAKWTAETGAYVHELRDEGLLKLFFASLVGPEETVSALEDKLAFHRAELERYRDIESFAAQAERYGPLEVLAYGITIHENAIRWCEQQLDQTREND